ncbi:hypothetical protein AGMMS50256_34740 [Betaproteobacteria bacterium]|nr:hypothetical protein AGMMS50256_34740 [Betaproteobacteria bacterium]
MIMGTLNNRLDEARNSETSSEHLTQLASDESESDEALRVTGLKTKREAVTMGLQTLLRLRRQEEIRHFRGKLDWEGDLNAMRQDG